MPKQRVIAAVNDHLAARQLRLRNGRRLTLRAMTAADLEAVEIIEQRVFQSPWSRRAFLHEINDNAVSAPIVALVDEELCGYLVAWMVSDELHIGTIAVDESWRRQGIAAVLLHSIFDLAREQRCTGVFLEVRRSNVSAQKLYERLGFQAVGVRPKYYAPQQEDAILMAKPLNGGPAGGGEEDNGLVQT